MNQHLNQSSAAMHGPAAPAEVAEVGSWETGVPTGADPTSAPEVMGSEQDRHPHLHAFTHALAVAGQVYGDAMAGLIMSNRPPEWQRAVDEYDRTHPRPTQQDADRQTGQAPSDTFRSAT